MGYGFQHAHQLCFQVFGIWMMGIIGSVQNNGWCAIRQAYVQFFGHSYQ